MKQYGRFRDPRVWLAAVLAAWLLFVWVVPASTLMLAVDDAYYYLRIARNVSTGHGISYDGAEPTTGFHPLWLAMVVPLTRIGGTADVVMRLMLSANLVFVAAAAVVLARQGERVLGVLALFLSSFWACKVLVCGQESSLAFLVMCLALGASKSGTRGWVLGTLAGVLIWSRFALAPMAFGLVLSPFGARHKRALVESAVAGGTALVIVLPWLAWVHAVDGRFVPVNASMKLDDGISAAIVLTLLVPVATTLMARRHERFVPLAPLVAQLVAQHTVDVFVRRHFVPEPWSLAPLVLGLLLAASRWAHGWPGRVIASGWLISAIAMWHHRLEPSSWSAYAASARTGDWVATHLARSATIAGWDSGIVASRTPQRFVNLDGLVHSVTVARAAQQGQLRAYLDETLRPDFVIGYIVPGSTDVKSTELGDLSVVHVECATFQGLFERSSRPYPIVVLARTAAGVRDEATLLAMETDHLCAAKSDMR